MKTLSKVLSMLLVIVMCMSFFGGSAYALNLDEEEAAFSGSSSNGLVLGGTSANSPASTLTLGDDVDEWFTGAGGVTNESNSGLVLGGESAQKPVAGGLSIDAHFAPGTIAVIGNNAYLDVESLNAAIVAGSYVKLADPSALTSSDTIVLANASTLDLNGKELKANVAISGKANITDTSTDNSGLMKGNISGTPVITGGSFSSFNPTAFVAAGYKVTGSSPWKVVPSVASYEASIGSTKYETLQKAYEAASNGATITLIDNGSAAAYSINSNINKNITIVPGVCSVDLSSSPILGNVTISGGVISGAVGVYGTLTLNNTNASGAGIVVTGGATLNVNGASCAAVATQDAGAVINMSSGTISALGVEGSPRLNVSGGSVTLAHVDSAATAVRAITGGSWTVGANKDFFEKCVADNYVITNETEPYTVGGKGGPAPTPTATPVPTYIPGPVGSYSLNTNTYYKNTYASVYMNMPRNDVASVVAQDQYGNIYYFDGYYSISGYTMNFSNSFLNSNAIASGTVLTFYIQTSEYAGTKNYNVATGCKLTVYYNGFDPIDPVDPDVPSPEDHGLSVRIDWRYDDQYWESGDNPMHFYMSRYPRSGNIKVSIDGTYNLGNEDWYDYGDGYFYVASSIFERLSFGTHKLTVTTRDGNGSCYFYIVHAPSIKPKTTNKHVIGSAQSLKFVCTDPILEIKIGDKVLDGYDDYYYLSNDRKTLTLNASFLNNRVAGSIYALKVRTAYGWAETTFQILTTAQASSSPQTGDTSNLALWCAVLLISGSAMVGLMPRKKNGAAK